MSTDADILLFVLDLCMKYIVGVFPLVNVVCRKVIAVQYVRSVGCVYTLVGNSRAHLEH